MNDASIYCRGLILAQSGVAALISTRCYEDPLPNDATLPAIAFETQTSQITGPMQMQTYNVSCWASTRDGAVALYGALVDALSPPSAQQQTVSGQKLSGIEIERSAGVRADPETENYVQVATITFWMAI